MPFFDLQLHFDFASSLIPKILSAMGHRLSTTICVLLRNCDNGSTIARNLGYKIGIGRSNILLYNTQKWTILLQLEEIFIRCWIFVAVHCDHHFVFMYLLYSAKATSKTEQAHLQQCNNNNNHRIIKVDGTSSGT